MAKRKGAGRYVLTDQDLGKRTGERRLMVLHALASVAGHTEKPKGRAAANPFPTSTGSLSPVQLARAWRLHPSTTYRCLERLRKARAVLRRGFGVTAEYEITEQGLSKLRWLLDRRAAMEQYRAKKAGKGKP